MYDDPLLFWRLAPDLSVTNAATLIAGGDPSYNSCPNGYDATLASLQAAIWKGQLKAQLAFAVAEFDDPFDDRSPRPSQKYMLLTRSDLERLRSKLGEETLTELSAGLEVDVRREPDWVRSMVDVEDLKAWLRSRGVTDGFFFPIREVAPDDFLDPGHDHFAPELALAVEAWRGLANTQTFHGGVKAAIEKWIDNNPTAWGGTGTLGTNARDRISTVANWKQQGGAPRTGG